MADVSLQDYIDQRTNSIDQSIKDLRIYLQDHFNMNDRALKLAREEMDLKIKKLETDYKGVNDRVVCLETSKAFSAGKMWMVMAGFAAIPTIIGIIAFIRTL
jgi:hypothetical protein